jgi:hypothetical protein
MRDHNQDSILQKQVNVSYANIIVKFAWCSFQITGRYLCIAVDIQKPNFSGVSMVKNGPTAESSRFQILEW